jgi:hypothetical protein
MIKPVQTMTFEKTSNLDGKNMIVYLTEHMDKVL